MPEKHLPAIAELPSIAEPAAIVLPTIPEPVVTREPEQFASKPDVNSWMAGAVSPWEAELQRASQLTATWQNASLAPTALIEDGTATEAFLSSGLMAAPHGMNFEDALAEDQPTEEPEEELDEPAEQMPEQASERAADLALDHPSEHFSEQSPEQAAADQFLAEEPVAFAGTQAVFAEEPVHFAREGAEHAPETENVSAIESLLSTDTQEILHEQAAQALAEESPAVLQSLDTALAASPALIPAAAPVAEMDEIVAKVLARMNPEILHAVTREILKPLVEAMIKNEMHKK